MTVFPTTPHSQRVNDETNIEEFTQDHTNSDLYHNLQNGIRMKKTFFFSFIQIYACVVVLAATSGFGDACVEIHKHTHRHSHRHRHTETLKHTQKQNPRTRNGSSVKDQRTRNGNQNGLDNEPGPGPGLGPGPGVGQKTSLKLKTNSTF